MDITGSQHFSITASTKEVQKRVEIFCCYARKDQPLLQELKNHLMPLKREGMITLWADTDINAGAEWEKEIHLHLNASDIILLLISPDFMASDYCYSIEMKRAMERHESGEAQVIPIILRPADWQNAPFAELQALPQDALPIISSKWAYQDEGFVDVARGIREVVQALLSKEELIHKRDATPKPLISSPDQHNGMGRVVPFFPPTHLQQYSDGLSLRTNQILEGEKQHCIEEAKQECLLEKERWHPLSVPLDPSKLILLCTLVGHEGVIRAIAFSPDGHMLASSSSDKTINLWNTSTGQLLHSLSGHEKNVSSISFSPDGRVLASASDDKTIILWDTSTGKKILKLPKQWKRVFSVSFSPDGRMLASSDQNGAIKFWNPSTGEHLRSPRWPHTGFCPAFSPDGQFLASAWSQHIICANFSSQTYIPLNDDHLTSRYTVSGPELHGPRESWTETTYYSHANHVRCIVFSPQGQLLASGSDDKTIKLWKLPSGQLIRSLVTEHSIPCIAFSPDSELIVSGCSGPSNVDFTIKFWDTSTGELLHSLFGHKGNISTIAFSPDGQTIASGGDDKTIKIWRMKSFDGF